jgi:hypothetical protein
MGEATVIEVEARAAVSVVPSRLPAEVVVVDTGSINHTTHLPNVRPLVSVPGKMANMS